MAWARLHSAASASHPAWFGERNRENKGGNPDHRRRPPSAQYEMQRPFSLARLSNADWCTPAAFKQGWPSGGFREQTPSTRRIVRCMYCVLKGLQIVTSLESPIPSQTNSFEVRSWAWLCGHFSLLFLPLRISRTTGADDGTAALCDRRAGTRVCYKEPRPVDHGPDDDAFRLRQFDDDSWDASLRLSVRAWIMHQRSSDAATSDQAGPVHQQHRHGDVDDRYRGRNGRGISLLRRAGRNRDVPF